jgi:hypothetical protein
VRGVRIHAGAFAAGALCLSAANWLSGGPWWSFWPIAIWAVALAGHYLIYKARTVDERWVEERAADLHSKSYDASHIDSIVARYDAKKHDEAEKPKN